MARLPVTAAPVTRFAPSPTGRLHLGHGFAAVQAEAVARASGGRFLLRIEDIDQGRCRPEFLAAIHADLAWLGLAPDETLVQSTRTADHRAALEALAPRLYPCTCTRTELAAAAPHAGETHRYAGTCRGRPPPPPGTPGTVIVGSREKIIPGCSSNTFSPVAASSPMMG